MGLKAVKVIRSRLCTQDDGFSGNLSPAVLRQSGRHATTAKIADLIRFMF
jgi:hypothetical protein